MTTRHLEKLLNPTSLALVGASAREGSPGLAIARNLISGQFSGTLFLVNPRYREILGETCHRSLKDLPEAPDLVILLSPERKIKRHLVQCARLGSRVVLVMTAVHEHAALHALARKLGIRLLGPYCAGIIRPHLNLNATYSENAVASGPLAIVSQSASLGAAMLDWAEASGIGFSALLSTGTDTDITLADLLDLLAEDQHTHAIIVYLDRVTDTRSFLSAISAAARIKPVVLLKSTVDAASYCDALTRTGLVRSSDSVFQAALDRAGVVRIRSFSNLFAAARILASGKRTRGKRLAIISNGAAPAMLASERVDMKGFDLPNLSADLHKTLHKALGSAWSRQNPLILRQAESLETQYAAAISAIEATDEFDAVLVIFVPDARNDPETVAEAVIQSSSNRIPVLACWMGDVSVRSSRERFSTAQIASFRTPEAATDGFDFLVRYHMNQQLLLQLPNPASRHARTDISAARELIQHALMVGDRVLGPQKTRRLLSCFGIAVLPAYRAETVDEAMNRAERIGFPVAMKLVSPNLAHKASVGGTRLNVASTAQVQQHFLEMRAQLTASRPSAEFRGVLIEAMHSPDNSRSLAVSITPDPTFGPALSVGIGGDLTSLNQHRTVQLPPLNRYLIEQMLANSRLKTYLGEFHHRPAVKTDGVAQALRQLSELACALPDVHSVHINPLRISDDGAMVMDAHVVLEHSRHARHYEHLAIHPYPWEWIQAVHLKHGRTATLRPIRPEDGESIRTLVRELSAESRYFRFMHAVNELSPRLVAQFTKLDYDRQMAFVAEPELGSIAGVSRYTVNNDRLSAEFAVVVADDWQGVGLASALMRQLMAHARDLGLQTINGDVLRSNTAMQGLMQSLGFVCTPSKEDSDLLVYSRTLDDMAAPNDPTETDEPNELKDSSDTDDKNPSAGRRHSNAPDMSSPKKKPSTPGTTARRRDDSNPPDSSNTPSS